MAKGPSLNFRAFLLSQLPEDLEMQQLRRFEIVCTTTWRSVVLETRNWWSEMGENVEAVHFRAICPCGKEHVGCSLPTAR
jgi:hypothetical protein